MYRTFILHPDCFKSLTEELVGDSVWTAIST